MKVMRRDSWPDLMDRAERSVLILAPWIDGELVTELFSFLPPIDVKILFPRSTLREESDKEIRYALRGVRDTNFDAEIRATDDELPACLVIDDEDFYYSETFADRLPDGLADSAEAIAYARTAWSKGRPWS